MIHNTTDGCLSTKSSENSFKKLFHLFLNYSFYHRINDDVKIQLEAQKFDETVMAAAMNVKQRKCDNESQHRKRC